jgi:hypothetical protein
MRPLLVLSARGIPSVDTTLEVMPEALPANAFTRDPRAFQTRVADPASHRRSLIWDLDGQPYSPTELTCKLWREFGVTSLGPSYYSHWRIVGRERSLWDEASDVSKGEV